MSSAQPRSRPRGSERELLEIAARAMAARGYRTYLDPDGKSYFDLAVRRGAVVGLLEGKIGRPRLVFAQALRRRAWADWVGVVVDSAKAAQALVERTASSRAAVVGVSVVVDGQFTEVRAPTPRSGEAGSDPFARHRARLREALEAIDRGTMPQGVSWSGVPREVRRASGGRAFAEWRLDEAFEPGAQAAEAAATPEATRSGAKRSP